MLYKNSTKKLRGEFSPHQHIFLVERAVSTSSERKTLISAHKIFFSWIDIKNAQTYRVNMGTYEKVRVIVVGDSGNYNVKL